MKELENNRCADIRHDTQSENRHPRHALSREQIHKSKDRASLHLPEFCQCGGTDTRTGDLGSYPVDGQQEQSEDNPFSEIRYAEDIPYAV